MKNFKGMNKIADFLKLPKAFFAAFYEKVTEAAKCTGKSVKEYVADDKNIHHLSLIAYDILPFGVKVGMRHEKFYIHFEKHYKEWRKKIFNIETTPVVVEAPTKVELKKPRVRKPVAVKEEPIKEVAKRAPRKAPAKNAEKPVAKKPIATKAPAKTAAKPVAKKPIATKAPAKAAATKPVVKKAAVVKK